MIGERLAEIRKDHGDRQYDLAQKLNVTVSAVRSWEQDKSSPSYETMVSICKLYDVSSDYLLGLSRVEREEEFSKEELAQLREYQAFLLWRRKGKTF